MDVCDADYLINLYRHFGQKAISALRRLGRKGDLKIPEGVVREIIRGTDNLARFIEGQRQQLEVSVRQNPALHSEIPRLEKLYGDKIRVGNRLKPRQSSGKSPAQKPRAFASAR